MPCARIVRRQLKNEEMVSESGLQNAGLDAGQVRQRRAVAPPYDRGNRAAAALPPDGAALAVSDWTGSVDLVPCSLLLQKYQQAQSGTGCVPALYGQDKIQTRLLQAPLVRAENAPLLPLQAVQNRSARSKGKGQNQGSLPEMPQRVFQKHAFDLSHQHFCQTFGQF